MRRCFGLIDGTPDTVHICADPNIGSSDDVGLFVHEATHADAGVLEARSWRAPVRASRPGPATPAIGAGDNPAPGPFFSFFDDYESRRPISTTGFSRTYSKPRVHR